MPIDASNKYTVMQKLHYDNEALSWNTDNKDPVVGSFDKHNSWQDYDEFLFKNLDTTNKIALDFGCGPGRNIVKFSNRFSRIDGVDISKNNLDKALIWCKYNNIENLPNLFVNDGVGISCIPGEKIYDVIFSTICLQHICVYDIRYSIFSDFHRLLKDGGSICVQMGFGKKELSYDYYENNYDAVGTNGRCDTRIDNTDQIKQDLYKIGFYEFDYDIRPVGPGDNHENWIFFRAKK